MAHTGTTTRHIQLRHGAARQKQRGTMPGRGGPPAPQHKAFRREGLAHLSHARRPPPACHFRLTVCGVLCCSRHGTPGAKVGCSSADVVGCPRRYLRLCWCPWVVQAEHWGLGCCHHLLLLVGLLWNVQFAEQHDTVLGVLNQKCCFV